jgi:GT2 family glycosyltransferase
MNNNLRSENKNHMPENRKGLEIIIVNFNTKSDTMACLSSIDGKADRIIVVDNASSDNSSEALRQWAYNRTDRLFIENKLNIGFGRANNQAIKLSRVEFILLLNSDTIVRLDAIDKLKTFMQSNPNIGMVGPRLLNADGSIQASVSNFPNIWFVIVRMFKLRSLFPLNNFTKTLAIKTTLFGAMVKSYLQVNSTGPLKVENISGACMMIRRSVIEQVGMFDENYFMYVEDIDLCKRIINMGWDIFYYPLSEVVHLVGKSSGGSFRDRSPISYQSLYYYFRKHHGRPYEAVVRLTVVLALTLRCLFIILFHPIKSLKGTNQPLKNYYSIIIHSMKFNISVFA